MLTFAFLLALIALILQGVLLPSFTLLAFAPWIALTALSSPLPKTVWLSALAGSIVDLLSDDPMGIHAINYVLSAAILHPLRKHFLFDRPFHFSLFTTLVSFVSTALQLFLLFLFDRRIPFTGKWVLGDLLGMPIADGIYALIWFAAPLFLYTKLRRMWCVWRAS